MNIMNIEKCTSRIAGLFVLMVLGIAALAAGPGLAMDYVETLNVTPEVDFPPYYVPEATIVSGDTAGDIVVYPLGILRIEGGTISGTIQVSETADVTVVADTLTLGTTTFATGEHQVVIKSADGPLTGHFDGRRN